MTYAFKHILELGFVLLLVAACSAKVVPPIQPASLALKEQDILTNATPALTASDADFIAAMLAP